MHRDTALGLQVQDWIYFDSHEGRGSHCVSNEVDSRVRCYKDAKSKITLLYSALSNVEMILQFLAIRRSCSLVLFRGSTSVIVSTNWLQVYDISYCIQQIRSFFPFWKIVENVLIFSRRFHSILVPVQIDRLDMSLLPVSKVQFFDVMHYSFYVQSEDSSESLIWFIPCSKVSYSFLLLLPLASDCTCFDVVPDLFMLSAGSCIWGLSNCFV